MRPGALFLLLLLHLQPAHSSPPATTPEPLSLDPGTLPWLASEPRGRTLTLLEAAAAVSDPEERVVVLISLTAGVKRYVLNLIASLTMHNVTAVAVLCYESRALQLCEALGFPACVDARACLPPGSPPIRNSEVGLERDEAAALYWGRHICALRLLREGYNVVGTDADAVAFSDLVRQFRQGVYLTGASAVFASEPSFSTEGQWPGRTGYINMINSGWYYATPLALPLFEKWAGNDTSFTGGYGTGPLDFWRENDQGALNRLAYKAYAFCDEPSACLGVAMAGSVPVWRHPSFFPGRGGGCSGRDRGGRPLWRCSARLPYLHTLCVVGWEAKMRLFDYLGLWLVDADGRPITQWGADDATNGTAAAPPVVPAALEVCPEGTLGAGQADGYFWDMLPTN